MPRGANPNSRKNLKSFKKGQIGNPTGINRKRPLTDRMFGRVEELLSDSAEGEALRKKLKLSPAATWGDAFICQLSREVMKGNVGAFKEFGDRIEGKSPERLEISGPEKKEISIRIIHDREPRPK